MKDALDETSVAPAGLRLFLSLPYPALTHRALCCRRLRRLRAFYLLPSSSHGPKRWRYLRLAHARARLLLLRLVLALLDGRLRRDAESLAYELLRVLLHELAADDPGLFSQELARLVELRGFEEDVEGR